jgi:predicted ester cyclase
MTRDQIAAMFERRRAAYERRDAAALAADYTPDCIVDSPSGGTHQGPEAAEEVLRNVFDALEVSVHQESLLIDGDLVAQVLSIEGKGVGRFLGLAPTGREFHVPGVFLYQLREGLIARERRIYDFTALLIQSGLLKAKPAE